MHIANSDKPVAFYSLDIILAVGYRANSTRAIEFRKWATKVLRQHITLGYTINRAVISSHYEEFMKAVGDIKALLPVNQVVDSANVLELVRLFADTWFSLDAYDKDILEVKGVTKKQTSITAKELGSALTQLKQQLMSKGEATELFGAERSSGAVEGIVGNVMQSFGGKAMYPSIEEKARTCYTLSSKIIPLRMGINAPAPFRLFGFCAVQKGSTRHACLPKHSPHSHF
ncbi:MAG: RhuM family protein [Patescibacteria group bacterium]